MSTRNILRFCGVTRKISIFFCWKKCLIWRLQELFIWFREAQMMLLCLLWFSVAKYSYNLTLALLNKLRCHTHFCQSDYLIQVFDRNSHILWQTMQIQIIWLLQKPTDLDLNCLLRQGMLCSAREGLSLIWTVTVNRKNDSRKYMCLFSWLLYYRTCL